MPYFSRLLRDNTEYFGRSAGRTNFSLVVGRTTVLNPAPATISRANSNQEHSPRLAACTIPWAPARQSCTIARAKSGAHVGDPRWSLTTSSSGRVAANFRIVSGEHLPPTPNSHDPRKIQ